MAKSLIFVGLLLATAMVQTAFASDPDLTTDYNVPNATVTDFLYKPWETFQAFPGSGVVLSNTAGYDLTPPFTGLNGLGITAVIWHFGPASQIDPHTHPRATELIHLLIGELQVGFVDTDNNLFETTLVVGELFLFPKGLFHFVRNNNATAPASAVSVLNSETPGTLNIAKAMFTGGGAGFPDTVISTSFGISTNTTQIDSIKDSVAVRNNETTVPS